MEEADYSPLMREMDSMPEVDHNSDVAQHGIGHNKAPLSERIFSEPDATIGSVLAVVLDRIRTENREGVEAVSKRAKMLATNSKRLPKELDDDTVGTALDLLADLGVHSEAASERKDAVLSTAKSVSDALAADCKPLEAGLAPLEKAIRPLLVAYLTKRLDSYNGSLQEGDERMTSVTARGTSGARATLSVERTPVVVDADAVPRDLCVPDMDLIGKALADGRVVPGVEERDSPTLRVYK